MELGGTKRIKVVQLGKEVFEFEGGADVTVKEAIEKSGFGVDALRTNVRLNGERVRMEQGLEEGDTIVIIPPIKGGDDIYSEERVDAGGKVTVGYYSDELGEYRGERGTVGGRRGQKVAVLMQDGREIVVWPDNIRVVEEESEVEMYDYYFVEDE